MKIFYQRGPRDKVPGAVVIDREDGSPLELVCEALAEDAAEALAKVRKRLSEVKAAPVAAQDSSKPSDHPQEPRTAASE